LPAQTTLRSRERFLFHDTVTALNPEVAIAEARALELMWGYALLDGKTIDQIEKPSVH
jgi:hypothetical protein